MCYYKSLWSCFHHEGSRECSAWYSILAPDSGLLGKLLWILGPFPDLCNYDRWNQHMVFSLPRKVFSVFCWWSTTSSVAPVDWQYDIWNEVSSKAVVSQGNFTGHLLVVGVKCVIPNAQFAAIKWQRGKKSTNKQTNLIQTGMHVSMLRCCKHSYNLLNSDKLERCMFSDYWFQSYFGF